MKNKYGISTDLVQVYRKSDDGGMHYKGAFTPQQASELAGQAGWFFRHDDGGILSEDGLWTSDDNFVYKGGSK